MLKSKTAAEMMVTRLVTLAPETHVFDGVDQLLKHNITGAPVVDEQNQFLGIFSEKCCMNVLGLTATAARRQSANSLPKVCAREFMKTNLVTLAPEIDAYEAIRILLKNKISGAPVVDRDNNFMGVFSEKNSMDVLIADAYEQLPTTNVGSLMNRDSKRVIAGDMDLWDVAKTFATTPLRRLVVVDDGQVVGQISRRDVLRAEQKYCPESRHFLRSHANEIVNASNNFESDQQESQNSPPHMISYFMDREPRTISTDTGLMGVASIFLNTPYRRLPVLKEKQLVGQISRRDLLNAANELFQPQKSTYKPKPLYLSSLVERDDAPKLNR